MKRMQDRIRKITDRHRGLDQASVEDVSGEAVEENADAVTQAKGSWTGRTGLLADGHVKPGILAPGLPAPEQATPTGVSRA